jgi:outer membrane lipoprotein
MPACTPAISPRIMQQVDRALTYGVLSGDPAAYQGKMVLLGGVIVQTTPKGGVTEIEVVQKELTSSGEPLITDKSAGRFLVVADGFLDPAIYKPDRRLTVAGEVLPPEVRRLGDVDYRYPVLAARDLHLWAPLQRPMNLYWGFGAGYPYAYPYWGVGPYPLGPWWP